ncbi:HAD-IIB family hydrolase [Streptomyces sp. SL13]|uniref:HAD-IIB family hydrolase n=1 Tax=Streptantibioticus silvisoli TaxID=2705255 RepID=A0AA90H9L4_9ACTN|nr:HAD-IIB family hydrolase [Streptantibioticus silvisoli]MDI5961953.1 HAD-IIB family hydrolase [Streptantibioticus silvisoli]MDI5970507.1 HAD-IIB family hydrolase [Streptantibioticus silvisoli]
MPPPLPPALPRLIATDLDGTLLRDDRTVSDRTVAALAAAEKAGIDVFFVTGRPSRWMDVVAEHTAGHGIVICANGAGVYDLRHDRLLSCDPLDAPDAARIAHALRAAVPGTSFAVERSYSFHREAGYATPWGGVPDSLIAPIDALLTHDADQPLLKLLARHENADPDEFLATALELLGGQAEVTRSSSAALLEISRAGVTKATTLARCCAERGITAAEVVAFGDMPNDLAMLAWAGTSYAVANAHPAVLAATARHTATNQDDGVARVIEALLERG